MLQYPLIVLNTYGESVFVFIITGAGGKACGWAGFTLVKCTVPGTSTELLDDQINLSFQIQVPITLSISCSHKTSVLT